jgi:hypothetical protein
VLFREVVKDFFLINSFNLDLGRVCLALGDAYKNSLKVDLK